MPVSMYSQNNDINISTSKTGNYHYTKNERANYFYNAAMTNYVINNVENANNEELVRKETLLRLLEYIENPKFVVKQTKVIKKYIEAKNNNELDKMLK